MCATVIAHDDSVPVFDAAELLVGQVEHFTHDDTAAFE